MLPDRLTPTPLDVAADRLRSVLGNVPDNGNVSRRTVNQLVAAAYTLLYALDREALAP